MKRSNPLLTQETAESTSVLQLWHQQVKQHHSESFRGIGLEKFPQDLWIYETLIWNVKPSLVIEIGINNGGFSLWLADRLRSLHLYLTNRHDSSAGIPCQPRIVGLDLDITRAAHNVSCYPDLASYIQLEIVDASNSQQIQDLASRHIHPHDKVMIIEDSAHIYETTFTCLNYLSPYISKDSYFIVEDGCVDYEHLREDEGWPRGVQQAIKDFLSNHSNFIEDDIGNRYIITCHPGGFLKRIS